MKKFMNNAGFTLVELIVVIAILGILAAVAVPAYTGYINKANETADITELDAIKTAAQAALATKGGVTEVVVSKGSVTAQVDNVDTDLSLSGTVDNETYDDDFKKFYTTTVPSSFATKVGSDAANTATWTDDTNQWVFTKVS